MSKLAVLYLTSLLLVTTSALSQDIRYNFDKTADFSKFKTYKWVTLKDAPAVDALTDKQIKAAIDAALAQKGLTKTDSDSADLFVAYQAALSTEQQFTTFSTGWGYGPGWYGGGWYGPAGGMTTGQTTTLYNGQLAVDMYESAKHDLAWRGVASKSLDPKAKPEKRQKNLDKAVAKLLKNYPPPVKK